MVVDEEVKIQMERKVLRLNYDNLAKLLDEIFPPEIKIKFIQIDMRMIKWYTNKRPSEKSM